MKSQQVSFQSNYASIMEYEIKQLKCSGGYEALNACCRQRCDQAALICLNNDCDCKKKHKQCFLSLSIQGLHNSFNNKIHQFKMIKQQIQKQIQHVFNQLSLFQQKILKDIDNSLIYFGITEIDEQILKTLISGEGKIIKGKHVHWLQENVKKDKKYQHETEKKMCQTWKKLGIQIDLLKKSVQDILFNQNCFGSFKNSTIIKDTDENIRISKLFDHKFKKAILIFRATRDSFLASKFHEKCDGISHTLTILQTDKGKIFGGYTPCEWKSDGSYSADKLLKSFIFQFNNNDKFTLKSAKSEKSIRNYSCYGPNFGEGADFYISDNSNVNKNSYANIGGSYQNANYIEGNANSQIKFSGQYKFTVKQYEVWKIQFD